MFWHRIYSLFCVVIAWIPHLTLSYVIAICGNLFKSTAKRTLPGGTIGRPANPFQPFVGNWAVWSVIWCFTHFLMHSVSNLRAALGGPLNFVTIRESTDSCALPDAETCRFAHFWTPWLVTHQFRIDMTAPSFDRLKQNGGPYMSTSTVSSSCYEQHVRHIWTANHVSNFKMPWDLSMKTPWEVCKRLRTNRLDLHGPLPPVPVIVVADNSEGSFTESLSFKQIGVKAIKSADDRLWSEKLSWERKCAYKKWALS